MSPIKRDPEKGPKRIPSIRRDHEKEAKRNPTVEFIEEGHLPGDEFQVDHVPEEYIFKTVKRVAIFTEAFLPKIDGVTKTAMLCARHLQQSGRELIIFSPEFEGLTPEKFGPSDVIAIPSLDVPMVPETKIGMPSSIVSAYLDEFKPDLIHLFSPATLSLSGLWYGQINELPIVANYQSDLPGYARAYGMAFLENPIKATLRGMHNNSHVTLTPTHYVIRQLKEWGFERLRHWPRGSDTERFNPNRRTEEMRKRLLGGRDDDSMIVLYVGRLATEKKIDLLLEAAKLEGVTLAIVGDGENRARLEETFGEHAVFTGYLFGEDLTAAYASADVFAFTGTQETFGQVVLEGMASGLPALVPNAGGVVDLVLDGINGYICQVTPKSYADRVRYLRDHPEHRARMAEHAVEYANLRPWTDVMIDMERFYEEAYHLNKRMRRGLFREFIPGE